MEYHATEELHVVVHHVPGDFVTARYPVVLVDGFIAFDADKILGGSQQAVKVGCRDGNLFILREAAGCLLHNSKGCREYLVERFLVDFQYLFLNLINLVEERFTLFQFGSLHLGTQLFHLLPLVCGRLADVSFQLVGLGAEGVVVELLDFRISGFHLLNPRLNLFHVAGRFVAKKGT